MFWRLINESLEEGEMPGFEVCLSLLCFHFWRIDIFSPFPAAAVPTGENNVFAIRQRNDNCSLELIVPLIYSLTCPNHAVAARVFPICVHSNFQSRSLKFYLPY